jgi:hypothetical protein
MSDDDRHPREPAFATDHTRPDGVDDATVEATGKLSEAFEYVERARGHLYELHQLMGHADLLFGEAADRLHDAGHPDVADRLRRVIVGRNVLQGRWTFQVVEEFDVAYYDVVRAEVRRVDEDLMGGARHVHESEMKDRRRSAGVPGHERRPPPASSGDDHP